MRNEGKEHVIIMHVCVSGMSENGYFGHQKTKVSCCWHRLSIQAHNFRARVILDT